MNLDNNTFDREIRMRERRFSLPRQRKERTEGAKDGHEDATSIGDQRSQEEHKDKGNSSFQVNRVCWR